MPSSPHFVRTVEAAQTLGSGARVETQFSLRQSPFSTHGSPTVPSVHHPWPVPKAQLPPGQKAQLPSRQPLSFTHRVPRSPETHPPVAVDARRWQTPLVQSLELTQGPGPVVQYFATQKFVRQSAGVLHCESSSPVEHHPKSSVPRTQVNVRQSALVKHGLLTPPFEHNPKLTPPTVFRTRHLPEKPQWASVLQASPGARYAQA